MVAYLRAFLFCDNCHVPFDSSSVPSATSVSEVRRAAKQWGWSRKRDVGDLCEDCTDQRRESD